MAISLHAVGSWATSTTTTQTVTLPTHAAGDMLIVRAIRKPYTSPTSLVCNTSGWAAAFTGYANGSTANGVGVGSMAVCVFYKEAASASETNPVVTWGATAAPGACVALSYQKGAGETWVAPTGAAGLDSTAATTINDTLGTHISVTSGDMVDVMGGWCDDSGTPSAVSISQPGVTYTVTSDIPATALDVSTSNDMAADGAYALATAGTSSGAATITASFGSSEQHICCMTRLRVAAATEVNAVTAAATGAAQTPTLTCVSNALAVTATATGATEWGADYETTILADSPVAYWRLGESAGVTADNAEGTATYDGSYVDTPTLGVTGAITGDSDTAVTFNGTSEYVSVPYNSALQPSAFSIEAWVKWASTGSGWNCIAGPDSYNAATGWMLYYNWSSGYWCFTNTAGVATYYTHTPTTDVWYHVVGTHTPTGPAWVLYVDGTSRDTDDANTINANSQTLYIGARHANDGGVGPADVFPGTIDEVALYDSVLTGTQVENHYAVGTGGGLSGATAGGSISVDAVTATATGAAQTPTLTCVSNALAVTATATAAGNTATVATAVSVSAVTATATAAGQAPTLTTVSNVAGVTATAAAAGQAPSLALLSNANATTGTATGAAQTPTLTILSNVAAVTATATGATQQPTLTPLSNVAAVTAEAAGTGQDASASVGVGVSAVTAEATGIGIDAEADTGGAPSTNVDAVTATATGTAEAPTLTLLSNVASVTATVTGTAQDATLTLLSNANATTGTATGEAQGASASVGVSSVTATVTGTAQDATLTCAAAVNADAATAAAAAQNASIALGIIVATVTAAATAYDAAAAASGEAAAVTAEATGTAQDATAVGSPSAYAWADTATAVATAWGATIPTISGYTRDENGSVIPLCTVDAFVSATNTLYGTTTSDTLGRYAFVVVPGTEHFLVAYDLVGDVYGVTARDLVA